MFIYVVNDEPLLPIARIILSIAYSERNCLLDISVGFWSPGISVSHESFTNGKCLSTLVCLFGAQPSLILRGRQRTFGGPPFPTSGHSVVRHFTPHWYSAVRHSPWSEYLAVRHFRRLHGHSAVRHSSPLALGGPPFLTSDTRRCAIPHLWHSVVRHFSVIWWWAF